MRVSILLSYAFQFYVYALIVRIFLTWIPTINWDKPFFKGLSKICDIYLTPFRMIIPSVGGLDFSPIIAILVLQFCGQAICTALFRLGI